MVTPVAGTDDRERLVRFVELLAERCRAQQGLEDFLLWNAGTLEYWIHILVVVLVIP